MIKTPFQGPTVLLWGLAGLWILLYASVVAYAMLLHD